MEAKLVPAHELGRIRTFFALAFGLSWLLWIAAALSGKDVLATLWLIPYVLGGFGPSVAGILLTHRREGPEGRRAFWRRVFDPRRLSMGWLLFIFLVFPVLFGVSILLNDLLGNPRPALETLAQIAGNPLMLIPTIVSGLLTGPLAEELGWRGFALDGLQRRWSPLVATLILALFWWAWHLPLFFMKGTTQYNWGIGTPYFWLFTAAIVPLSILLTAAYNANHRSIFAAVLLHFMHNFTVGLVYPFSATVYLIEVILLGITAAGIILVSDIRSPVAEPALR